MRAGGSPNPRQPADRARQDRFAPRGTGDGRKTEGETLEIVFRIVWWQSVLFDCAEQFAHRPVESVRKPLAFESRPPDAVRCEQRDFLRAQILTTTLKDAVAAGDVRRIEWPVACVGVEYQRGLCAVIFNNRLGEQRRVDLLRTRSGGRREDQAWCPVAKQACRHVEPVDGEIIENKVFDIFKGCAPDPAVVPVDAEVGRRYLAEQSGRCGSPQVTEVRRPASVLVDGKLDSTRLGMLYQPLALVEIEYKWLLAQYVLTCIG